MDRTVSWKAMADFSKAQKEARETRREFERLQDAEEEANASSVKSSAKADEAGAKREKGLKGLIGRLAEYSKETTKAEAADKHFMAATLKVTDAEERRVSVLGSLTEAIRKRGKAAKDAEAADRSAVTAEESHTTALARLKNAVEEATRASEGNAKQSKETTQALKSGVRTLREVEVATTKVTAAEIAQAKASNNAERAALNLSLAEEKLTAAKNSNAEGSEKVRRAEVNLAQARISSSAATTRLQHANHELSESHSRVERSTRQVTTANRDMERSHGSAGRAMTSAGGAGRGLSGVLGKLVRDSNTSAAGMQVLSKVFALMKIPIVIGGLTQLVAVLSSLAAGAIAVAGALGPAVGILATIPVFAGAAATAMGTVLAAFSGVGDALKATSAAQKTAGADAIASAKTQATAARRVADSLRSVQDARRAADDAAINGAERVAAATRSLRDAQDAQRDTALQGAQSIRQAEQGLQQAQRTSEQAQRDLTQARLDAIRTLRDLRQAVKDEALSEERASLTVEQAKERLAETLRDPGATELQRRDAQLSVREAEAALERTRQRAKESADELKKAQKLGVERSSGVVSAKEAERSAILGVAEAQATLAEATKQAARSNENAAKATADAQKEVGKAVKDAARGQADAARAVADAQRNLAEAYAAQAEAANESSAAATKAKEAMQELGPAGQRFVTLLLSLKGNLKTIRDAAQEGLFPGLGDALVRLSSLTPLVADAFARMGAAMGRAAVGIAEVMTTPLFQSQFKELTDTNVKIVDALGRTFENVARTMLAIAVAAQPLVLWLVSLAEGWTENWDAMTQGEDSRKRMEDFFTRTKDVLILLGGIIGGLAEGFFNIGKAGDEMGLELLTMLDGTIAKWAEWTGSIEGQNELTKYFDDAQAVIIETAKLIRDIGIGLLELGNDPGTARLIEQIRTELLPAFFDLAGVVTEGLLPAFVNLVTEALKFFTAISENSALLNIVEAMGWMLEQINALIEAFPILGDVIGIALTALAALGIIAVIVGWIASFVTAIGVIGGALSALALTLGIGIGALLGWIAVIALVIAALVVAAYFIHKHWDDIVAFFKRVMGAILKWMKDVWGGPNGLKATLVDPLVDAFWAVVHFLTMVWDKFIEILGKVLDFLVWWGTNLYNYWIAPLVKIAGYIAKFFAWLIQKFTEALMWLVKWIAKAGVWIYNNLITPFVNAMKKLYEIWGSINKAISDAVKWLLRWLGTNISKAFGIISKPFKDAWDWVVKKFGPGISKAFSDIWATIKRAAEGFKTTLGTIWGKVKDVFAEPVRWVVNTVLAGLVGAYNQLVQMLGLGNANDPKNRGISITAPKVNFARGGVYPGYTPGKDIGVVGVSGGEAIMRPEWTRAVGKDQVDEMNAAARRGGVSGVRRRLKKKQGYADGGVVPRSLGDYVSGGAVRTFRGKKLNTRTISMLLAAESLPQMRRAIFTITQGSYNRGVSASFGTHDGGGVMDTNGPAGWGDSVWSLRRVGFAAWHRTPQQGFSHHIHSVALDDDSASPSAKDQMAAYRAGRNGLAGGGADDGPRVAIDPNLAKRFAIAALTAGGAAGSGGSWLDSLVGWVRDAVTNPLDYFKAKIGGPVKEMIDRFGNTKIVQVMTKVPEAIVKGMAGKIAGAVTGLAGKWADALTSNTLGSGGTKPGDPAMRAMVQAKAAAYGWTGAQWTALDSLIQRESGWNPSAQNPTSTAYGLFQFLNGTWASVGATKTSDPAKQTDAGLKYIKARYGGPLSAIAFWNGHHYYDEGGVVPNTRAAFAAGAESGDVVGMRRGGKVPGSGAGDKVPALLEPGEFVVRKKVAAQYKSQLEQLNARNPRKRRRRGREGVGEAVQFFHAGGPVMGIRKGMTGNTVRALRYLLNLPTGASAIYGKWDSGFDRIIRQTGAHNRLSNTWKARNRDPRYITLANYLRSGPIKSYAQGRDRIKVNDATMMKIWEGMRVNFMKSTPSARWKKMEQGYIAKRRELYGYAAQLQKSLGLGHQGSSWNGYTRGAMKHVLDHVYGRTHDPLSYRPWLGGFTPVEAAAAAAKAANVQQKAFNTALETLSTWGMSDLVADLLEKGVTDGLAIAQSAVKNRPAAQILNDQIALSKLLTSEDQGNILKLISMFSAANGASLGLRDVARNLGLSDLDTVLLIEKGLKANRFAKVATKMAKVRTDIASYRAGTFYGATGGRVPGHGRGDRVPAMLEPGEFVIRRKAAEYLGLRQLQDLNNIQRLRAGGLVQQFQLMSQPAARVPGLSNAIAHAAAGFVGGNVYNYNYDVDIINPVAEKSTVSLTKALQRQAAMNSSAGGKES